jgi:hypothetical protein
MPTSIASPHRKAKPPRRRRGAEGRVSSPARNLEIGPCFVVLGMMYVQDHWANAGSVGIRRTAETGQATAPRDPKR